jgi:trk system potassium uptake protein TrkH
MTKWLFESEVEDLKIIFRDTGPILMALGFIAALPAVVSLLYQEFITAAVFLFSGTLYYGLGFFFKTTIKEEKKGSTKHASISVALIWLIAIFLGAVPFLLVLPPLDALFESTAGFTTTGFTLIKNVLEVEKGILFWRSLESFTGGVLFVVSFLTLSKSFEVDSDIGFKERMEDLSAKVLKIYIPFAVIGILLFLLSGTTIFEAFGYSFSSISTGGFFVNGSLGAVTNSRAVIVSLLLTFVGSMNVLLIFKILEGDVNEALKNIEIQTGVLILSLGILAVWFTNGNFLIEMYHFISALTTSGFMIVDTPWLAGSGDFYKTVLIFTMLIGGSVYSTAGGLKIYRVVVLLKSLFWRISTLLPDKNIVSRKIHNIEDLILSDEDLIRAYTFAGLFFLVFGISGLVLSAYGYPVLDGFFESASALSNVGMSTGIVSPAMPSALKALFIFDMLLGRLEIMALGVLIFYFSGKIKAVTIGR